LKTSRYMGYIDKGDRMLIAIQLVREHEKWTYYFFTCQM
jgi:hypothetical protein